MHPHLPLKLRGKRIPPEEWRNVLRDLLRQCTYLPDPIARSAIHDQIMFRFRRYHEDSRPWVRKDSARQVKLHKSARHDLSILRRANEGYSRPLEKVLRYAYGRNGKRRREMLTTLLESHVPTDSSAVKALLNDKDKFGDEWKPPAVLIDLLKSQNNNPIVTQLSNRPPVRDLEPRFPKKTTWGDELSQARRRNIRKEWYNSVLGVVLPPLPDSELQVLEGLMDGSIKWKPQNRRRILELDNKKAAPVRKTGRHLRTVLTEGPTKEETFEAFTSGRSHTFTYRFMRRMWKRISCLVPRARLDSSTGKYHFTWDTSKTLAQLAIQPKMGREVEMFKGLDSRGRKRKELPRMQMELPA